MPIIAVALVIAAALGGGTAYAAQTSLPGDPLWNFKTTVNESVQGALQSGDKAKADWDITVAADRLDEAQKLAAQGRLDPQAQAAITANFDAHAHDLAMRVERLQADGKTIQAADVATRFQAQLAEDAANVRASATSTTETNIEPFLSNLRGTLDAAASLSAKASADAESSVDASVGI